MSDTLRFTIPEDMAGQRLDKALAGLIPPELAVSRARVQALIAGGCVYGGAPVTDPARRVKMGEKFVVNLPAPIPPVPEAQACDLDILYEDDHLLVLNKPAGMVVHPAPGNRDHTLVNALLAHCGTTLSGIGGVARPGIVHRLDKETSGLMVVAKNDAAHQGLSAQFADRTLSRTYQAVVWGVPAPRKGEIEGNIGRHKTDRKRMAVLRMGGKPALTRYQVLDVFDEVASLVQCELATGRTHQIRVHMTHIGHPLVGDPVYGRQKNGKRPWLRDFPRQALHAQALKFIHPVTHKLMRFACDLPPDMRDLLENMRGK